MVTVDYLTNFWKVDFLRVVISSQRHSQVESNLCQVWDFSKAGQWQRPQFTSQGLKTFTDEWEIERDLTSPYHPQAIGKAESAVKMAKTLMKKARHSKSDFYLMLLEYENTPTQVLAQLLHSECSVER